MVSLSLLIVGPGNCLLVGSESKKKASDGKPNGLKGKESEAFEAEKLSPTS